MNMRIESDSIGSRELPAEVYYGVQSLRAMENFPITGRRVRGEMIVSLALLKKACAITNASAGVVDKGIADAIEAACEQAKATKGKPTAVIMKTVKGKGVSFMENSVKWHGSAPKADQYEQAVNEINAAIAAL